MHPHQRLRDRADFQRVARGGRRWNGRLLTLGAVRNDSAQTRVGFAVSRAVGKAVVRNRIRRRLREIARHTLPALPAGWDLVVTARGPASGATFAELGAAWSELMERMRPALFPTGGHRRRQEGHERDEGDG